MAAGFKTAPWARSAMAPIGENYGMGGIPPSSSTALAAPGRDVLAWWGQWVRRLAADLAAVQAEARAAAVVLPTLAHCVLARQAWAGLPTAGWMPRFETPRSLAASLAPAPPPDPEGLSFDLATDHLHGAQLLRATSWGRSWERQDPRAFESTVQRLVQCAHEFGAALSQRPAGERATYLAEARGLLGAEAGPGQHELGLARLALEWAAQSGASYSDALFVHRPSAWGFSHLAAPHPLCTQLARVAAGQGVPVLEYVLRADDWTAAPGVPAPALHVCTDLEDEAQETAAQVLERVRQGQGPVALIAQDRALVRRVRSLLERRGTRLSDETGWTLSTTRAAAAIVGVLRAAHPMATTDEVLDVLKSADPGALGLPGAAVDALEAAWRKEGWSRAWTQDLPAPVRESWAPEARALHDRLHGAFAPLRTMGRVPWLQALARWREVLQACGVWQRWAGDAAGTQVLQALHLREDGAPPPGVLGSVRGDAQQLRQWADLTLESREFVPPAADMPEVVITPLSQAVLRPFGSVVLPGADDVHFAPPQVRAPLLGAGLRQRLGLEDPELARVEPWQHFLLLAHHADLLILHRAAEEDQPLGASVWVKRLDLLLHRRGLSWSPAVGARDSRTLVCTPPSRPLPTVEFPGPLWPRHLSAQGYEDLRDCPYRFYARHVLRLREVNELDEELEPKDLGLWVHAVFQHFHDRRLAGAGGGGGSADDDVRRLRQTAQEQAAAMGLLGDDFLPHRLWFDALAEGYVRWLHAVEAQGQHYRGGEMSLEARVAELEAVGVTLQGRIDRLDVTGQGGALLIDYKTSSAQRLKERTAEPAEETQLTFYALLYALSQRPRQDLDAACSAVRTAYLPLPSRPGEPLQPLQFDDAGANARRLLHAMAHDLSRLARGAPMPALGHEAVCERCQARGLCRRDDWSGAVDQGAA